MTPNLETTASDVERASRRSSGAAAAREPQWAIERRRAAAA